jgi:hypothetical protein
MISPEKFKNGIQLLEKHFGKDLQPAVVQIWGEYLDQHLDDESFTFAIKEVIIASRFFPTAKELVEYAIASQEATAIIDWQLVLQAARLGRKDLLKGERLLQALELIGGLSTVGATEERYLPRLEKQFIAIYSSPQSRLPSLSLPPSVALESSEKETPPPIPEELQTLIQQLKSKKSWRKV